jgi:hypothetical protein
MIRGAGARASRRIRLLACEGGAALWRRMRKINRWQTLAIRSTNEGALSSLATRSSLAYLLRYESIELLDQDRFAATVTNRYA